MTKYTGTRGQFGTSVAVVDPDGIKDLDPRVDLANHSPTGFEWGYAGSGPAQLALAILADYTGNEELALRLHQQFKDQIVSKVEGDTFWINGDQIEQFLNSVLGKHESNFQENQVSG